MQNKKDIDGGFIFQLYHDSDRYKWEGRSEEESHFSRAEQKIAGYKWVKGTVSFSDLMDVELTRAGWAKTLTEGSPNTLRYALLTLEQLLENPPEAYKPDFEILRKMICALKNDSFKADQNFIIIIDNTVYDGNHRLITLPFVLGSESKTTCFLGTSGQPVSI